MNSPGFPRRTFAFGIKALSRGSIRHSRFWQRVSTPSRATSSYETARWHGYRRLFGGESPTIELNGEELTQVMEELITRLDHMLRIAMGGDSFSDPRRCLETIQNRLDAWAVFLAIDHSYQQQIMAGNLGMFELGDAMLGRLEEMDSVLNQNSDKIARYLAKPQREQLRKLLSAEFCESSPGWLCEIA